MKCNQCERPAMYQVTEQGIPLCLSCYKTWSEISNVEFLKYGAMLNYLEEDASRLTGYPFPRRLPVAEIAAALERKSVLNNINISQSQIGVLNTGSIQKIDAAITLSKGSDSEVVGASLQDFADGVIKAPELSASEKNELLELTETLAEQVVSTRKPATIRAIMKEMTARVGDVAALTGAFSKLYDSVKGLLPDL